MKTIKTKLEEAGEPERVTAFEKGAQVFAKKIVANFKDYEFVRPSLLIFARSFAHEYSLFLVHW